MAKKSSIARNERRKALVKKYVTRRMEIKKKLLDPTLSEVEYWAERRNMAKLPKDSSPIRVRNRCAVTGRSRGYHRWFGLSRIQLREMISFGEIPGVTKSSW
ncbi:MAG: 30S ribosomal protein S14 [Puniceicoccales bacterium]|jgi:small subunit ribosomal protein S14|nr:30S ribosomal protein S14 [Puniceicoccales bacterium]